MKTKKKIDFKEFFRKIKVSLKKRPHNIPFAFLIITYIFYSVNFDNTSYTTALIGRSPMGLCTFIIMLFSILGIVSFMNAFPKRQKPKTLMVIIFYVIQVFVLAAGVYYILVLEKALNDEPVFLQKKGAEEIVKTELVLFIHTGLMVFSTLLVALIPVLGKIFSKFNTTVVLEENNDISLDLND